MLRSRRIADYITPQKKSRARATAGGAPRGAGEGGRARGGGAARFNDLGLARAAAKVSVQLYTVIIHAPTSLPTHTLIMLPQRRS